VEDLDKEEKKEPFYKVLFRLEWLLVLVGAGLLIYAEVLPYLKK